MSGSFLYPMLEGHDDEPADRSGAVASLLADLRSSAAAKAEESATLREATLRSLAAELDRAADAMADALTTGGRIFCFGNGGSATDAAGLAALFTSPLWGRPLPARSLSSDPAVLTALANDIGVEAVFSRQLIAHARPGDIAVGLSTSGGSANVLQALAQARRTGLLTVGLAGYGGGAMRSSLELDHCLAVDAQSVHRTQEAQSAVGHALWERVQRRVADEEAS